MNNKFLLNFDVIRSDVAAIFSNRGLVLIATRRHESKPSFRCYGKLILKENISYDMYDFLKLFCNYLGSNDMHLIKGQ